MDLLLHYFIRQGISEQEALRITTHFSQRKIAKGDFFVQEGKVCRYMGFAEKGLFRYYYLRDGNEITTYVSGAGSFLLSLASFFRQQPSVENIRAFADASVWQISFAAVQQLKKEEPAFLHFYVNALENLTVSMDETRSNLIILTAEERYALLVKNEPELLKEMPLQYLASVLGVTPRHLGRIRNNFTGS